jgi:hypothetical protein
MPTARFEEDLSSTDHVRRVVVDELAREGVGGDALLHAHAA